MCLSAAAASSSSSSSSPSSSSSGRLVHTLNWPRFFLLLACFVLSSLRLFFTLQPRLAAFAFIQARKTHKRKIKTEKERERKRGNRNERTKRIVSLLPREWISWGSYSLPAVYTLMTWQVRRRYALFIQGPPGGTWRLRKDPWDQSAAQVNK